MVYHYFSFPLNVYAHALFLEEGEVRYLHYGLDFSGDILAAQERATEYLLGKLPDPPQKLLEVGVGLCTTARLLQRKGYLYVGVVPDKKQVDLCNELGIPNIYRKFEDIDSENKYDVILFQESAQYIHPQKLLEKTHAVLHDGGKVIIADEVDVRIVPAMKELAHKHSMELVAEEDITKRASPSLDYLVEIIYRHRSCLLRDLNITSLQLSRLLTSLDVRRDAFFRGEYAYLFLALEKRL